MSLFAQFKRIRDERPESAAFLIAAGDRSVPITWQQFSRDVEAIAWLAREFIPGSTVGLLGENSYEWITAHVAGVFAGLTVVPIEVGLSPKEIADRLTFVGAKALVHSALYLEKAREVEALVPDLIVAGFGSRKADEYMAMARNALDGGAPGVFDLPPRDEDETAMIVFTSGTTSTPRGAELTLGGIAAFSSFATEMLKIEKGERSLMLLPLHHIFGVCTTYMMLANGVSLGVCPDFRRIYDAVARFRANFIFLVPALADILASKISQRAKSAEAAFGSSIDWILVGGAPLPSVTAEKLHSLGIRAITGYGLTETTALYSISAPEEHKTGSAGKCCNGRYGMETKVGESGTLMIRGPAVLKRYYKEPERTADILDGDGWLDTGDVGRIDEDGCVWITGRRSRTIVLSSGKKVAPEELEEKILSIPGTQEVVVSGDGETRDLKAEIYSTVSETTVRRQVEALNRTLPVHKRIKQVVVRDEPFPRTSSGKIRLPPNPCRQAPKRRAHYEHPLAKTAFWVFTGTSAFVLVSNTVQMALARAGAKLPPWLDTMVGVLSEWGEIFLAILVLPTAFIVYDFYRTVIRREN